tara:strand:+ start:6838 stop:7401 length:564 start_codon:yes stop_codon:yes gene_type:complete
MPMPAVLGTIAQQGQAGGSAPTGVSIATSSAGNYDNAVIVFQANELSNTLASNDGSTFSSNSVNIAFGYNSLYLDALTNFSGVIIFGVQGFIRATGATNFQWGLALPSVNDSGGAISSSNIVGTASTDQDETSGSAGHAAHFQHNSGGRGYQLMVAGDDFLFNVGCSASNSGGSTDASGLSINIEVT